MVLCLLSPEQLEHVQPFCPVSPISLPLLVPSFDTPTASLFWCFMLCGRNIDREVSLFSLTIVISFA